MLRSKSELRITLECNAKKRFKRVNYRTNVMYEISMKCRFQCIGAGYFVNLILNEHIRKYQGEWGNVEIVRENGRGASYRMRKSTTTDIKPGR